jgi:hypothetical protein
VEFQGEYTISGINGGTDLLQRSNGQIVQSVGQDVHEVLLLYRQTHMDQDFEAA